MTFTALLTAALRFQRRHILGRTVAVATGLVMMVAVLELQGALDRGVATVPGDLGPAAAVVVRGPVVFSSFGAAERPGVSVDDLPAIAASAGVTALEGDDHGPIGLVSGSDQVATELGTWFVDDGLRPAGLTIGEAPGEDTVAVSTALATDLGLSTGDPVVLVGEQRVPMTVSGIVDPRQPDAGAPDVYAAPSTTNALVGTEGQVERVVVTGTGSEEELASAVFVNNPELETLTRTNFDGEREGAERDRAAGTRRLLTLFAGITMAVTALIVVSATAAAVVRRTRELATLRTAGATPRQIRQLILTEAATVGLVGGLVAGPLGTLTALLLQDQAGGLGLTLTGAGPRLDLTVLAVSVVLGIILSLVGAWFPARRAGTLSLRAALGDLAEAPSRFTTRAALAGVLLAAAGLILSGTGSRADASLGRAGLAGLLLVAGSCILATVAISGLTVLISRHLPARRWPIARLAVGNLARSPARTSGTAVSVLVGIGLVMLTNVFTSSFQANVATSTDQLYRTDSVVTATGDLPGLPRADLDPVAATFGVEAATPVRQDQVKIGSAVGTAVGLDGGAFLGPAFSASSVRAFGDDGILVRSGLGIARGGEVMITGANGEVQVQVAGTFGGRIVDASGGQVNAVIPLEVADRIFSPGPDEAILVRTFGEAAAAGLDELSAADPVLEVRSAAGYAARNAGAGNRAFTLSVALLGLTLVTAVIGLANTVAASVNERRREMSVLRALGVGAGQLARLVTFETAILAAMVAVAATVVAAATGVMLVGSVAPEGTPISVPWLRLVGIGAAATVVCSLAGLVPALSAARIPVQSGLDEE